VDLPQPAPPHLTTVAAAVPAPPMQPPSPPQSEPQPAPLRIDLRGDNSDSNTVVLPAPQVIPASVNTRFHNKEPVYPAEAQHRAEQGAVVLLIHVAADGLPAGVDITSSSGYPVLDRAATDAVWKWHFVPATQAGQPVPFDMSFRIVFQLD
jgi:protein TonB